MMRFFMISTIALFAAPALAQVDIARCATVTVASAETKDLPALIGGAGCFGKAAVFASTSQASRLARTELEIG